MPIIANFCQFLPIFADFCQYQFVHFQNSRGGNGQIGINRVGPPPEFHNETIYRAEYHGQPYQMLSKSQLVKVEILVVKIMS